MIDIIMSNPLKDKDAFWTEVEPVETDTLLSLYESKGKHSWSYDGKNIVYLPEMPVSDVLEYARIHKLLKNIPDSFHKTHLYVFGDYFGLTTHAIDPYKYTFLDAVNTDYINPTVKDYVIKEEELASSVVMLTDHVEVLYEIDVSFEYAYLLTKNIDTLTLVALDYMLKGIASTIDVDFYFDVVKLITCDPYTLLKVKRVDLP